MTENAGSTMFVYQQQAYFILDFEICESVKTFNFVYHVSDYMMSELAKAPNRSYVEFPSCWVFFCILLEFYWQKVHSR